MNKKTIGRVLFSGMAFAAMGCPSDATGGGASDYAARLQAALERESINCNFNSTAAAKSESRQYGAIVSGLLKLPGVSIATLEKNVLCREQQAETCKSNSEIPACQQVDENPRGTLKNGDACIVESQCASGACKGGELLGGSGAPSCGTCADGVGEGADCSIETCAPGLSCRETISQTGTSTTTVNKCAKLSSGENGAKVGESCSNTTYCADGGYCDGSICKAQAKIGESCASADCVRVGLCATATKLCTAMPKLGESCKDSYKCAGGAACVDDACVDGSTYVALGGACNGETKVCGPDLRCKSSGNAAACIAAKKLGESCDAGTPCSSELFCSSVSKTCKSFATDLSCPLK